VKKTACGTNEWFHSFANATHDMDCRACRVCPEGSYKTGNCTGTADTICTPYTVCPTGQFGAGDSAFADITCAECSVCSQSEFIAQPCDEVAGTDTVCMLATLCDDVAEYEIQAPTTTSDRQCANCSVCEADERISSPCGATTVDGQGNNVYHDNACVDVNSTVADLMCPRGQAPMGTNPYIVCSPCQPCNGVTQFAKGGAYCLDDPVAKIYSPRCEAVTECSAGFAEIATPTATSDRVCSAGVQCPVNSYSTSTRITADVVDLVCIPDPPCASGFYEIVPATPQSPRQCTACTVCPNGEYASRECTGAYDTACSKISPCATSQAVLRGAGSNTNTVCVACSDRVKGRNRPNDDPFMCVESPPSTCPVTPAVTAPAGSTEYSQVSFAMTNDFRTVVQYDPLYQQQLDDFTAQLNDYLVNMVSPWVNLGGLFVTEGSIVTSFYVTGSGNSTHEDAADAVVASLANGTFAFSYHGADLTVDLASITVVVVDASTANPTAATTQAPVTGSPTPAPTVPPPTTDSVATDSSDSDSDDGLSHNAVVGIVLAAVIGLILAAGIAYVVYNKANENPWSGTNAAFNSTVVSNDNDEYLNMNPDGEDGVFDSQLAGENARLQDEVDNMGRRIAEKNAVISEQLKAQRLAQETLEVAIAAKLAKENSVLQAEISAMKKDIKKKQHSSKFQKVAADQARLRAEKLVLEEEIARSDEVAQVALDALSEYDTLQESYEEEENAARSVELQRIQDEKARIQEEKARLAGEMQKLESRTASLSSPK
jgi:hypothetical protein